MSLRSTNLNLLPVLQALLRHQSVSGAAQELCLSQPATSHALARLRLVFGDPLLVTVGRTMQLTPRASAMIPEIDAICASIATALETERFDPAMSTRSFVVATTDYMALLLAPVLLDILARDAPQMSLRFGDVGDQMFTQLAQGNIDIAIIADAKNLTRGFQNLGGFCDSFVGVVAAGHPFATTPPRSMDELLRYQQIGIDHSTVNAATADAIVDLVQSRGNALRISLSQMLILPLLVAQTGHFAIVPKILAEQGAKMASIAVFSIPQATPNIDLCQIWSPIFEADAAHRWLRLQIQRVMSGLFEPVASPG